MHLVDGSEVEVFAVHPIDVSVPRSKTGQWSFGVEVDTVTNGALWNTG